MASLSNCRRVAAGVVSEIEKSKLKSSRDRNSSMFETIVSASTVEAPHPVRYSRIARSASVRLRATEGNAMTLLTSLILERVRYRRGGDGLVVPEIDPERPSLSGQHVHVGPDVD